MKPLLFIHIPKTAGTSFREGAGIFWGEDKILNDYGEKSPETSKLVFNYTYRQKDIYGLYKAILKNSIEFITGHYSIKKYLPAVEIGQAVAFVRDPVQRVVSEYKHFVRNYGYEKSFEEFYHAPRFRNCQHRLLNGVPLESIGFLGLTEQYEFSLALLNQKYGIEIPFLAINMGKESIKDVHNLTSETINAIRKLNQGDMALYQLACLMFEQRRDMYDKSMPFVRGRLGGLANGMVSGWAAHDTGDLPVEIELWHNERRVGSVLATDYRPQLKEIDMCRRGFVGFTLPVENPRSGDKLHCRVGETAQELGNSPLTVP
ncbi:MAG: sulfotransferase family 2 domain-containing protein [Thermodesulfobacteriota bacterium]|nr:sulfotransferase family 2 domain-containing protein [Thermodesulfobacteriota bacterium]